MSPPNKQWILLAREMLLNAEEFHRSAVVLTNATEAHTDTHLTNPMTVLFAFSAEMYLKSLIAFYGQREVKGKKGHDLKFLFDEHVHEPARCVIKRTWEIAHPEQHVMREAVAKALGRAKPTFEGALAASANAFVQWRYHYDYANKLRGFHGDLVGAFRASVFNLLPVGFRELALHFHQAR